MTLAARVSTVSRELKLFVAASFMIGIAGNMVDAVLNNFLNYRFELSGFERSFLEFPRELPGFLVMFTSAVLWFLCSRRLGALTMLLAAVGALLVGFASTSYNVMVVWLFIYSLGQHTFMPVNATIGMELAEEGKTGQRLGQLNAVRNLATILGSFIIYLGFQFLGFTYQNTFLLAAIAFLAAGFLLFSMKTDKPTQAKTFLTLKREYRLFYALAVLYGSRKQLFITFAPWVLVQVFQQPPQTIATLIMIGGVIGILFQPFLGWTIDHLGEKVVLASEAVLLVFVCFGYGFAKSIFPENIAFLVICGCYLFDQMLMSVSMARSTYLKKTALRPEDIQPALSASVTIDHVFSITAALLGGVIWNNFGFQYVFLMGTLIAAANFFTVLRIRLPKPA
jgi:predicted MFS family arabinose efflux permease